MWLAFTIPQEFEKCHVLAGVKALADATSCGMQGSRARKRREEEEWQGKPSAKRERALQLCRTPFAEGWLFVRDKSGLRNLGVGT